MEKQLEADVVIIGGGITGAAIARELSRYKVDTVLLEKGGELCAGQSKGSIGLIYTGLMMLCSMLAKTVVAPDAPIYEPHTLKMRWCEEGFQKGWPQLVKELDIKHRYLPVLVVAKDEEQVKNLNAVLEFGNSLGGVHKLLPVRSNKPILKDRLMEYAHLLAKIRVRPPVKMGQIISRNILHTGVDVISSDELLT
jgi:glycerol-3-phosphate dehydrogenase